MYNRFTIRAEQPGDHRIVEALIRDAFWDVYKPGADEHLIAHRLRSHPDFIPALDFVALDGDEIVGSILFSRAAIVQPDGTRLPIALPGPLAVRPDRQRQGVGAALLRHSLEQAKALGLYGADRQSGLLWPLWLPPLQGFWHYRYRRPQS